MGHGKTNSGQKNFASTQKLVSLEDTFFDEASAEDDSAKS